MQKGGGDAHYGLTTPNQKGSLCLLSKISFMDAEIDILIF